MKNEPRRFAVSIYGETYTLVSDEDEKGVCDAASRVDRLMHELSSQCEGIDSKRLAVLASIQLARELAETKEKVHYMESDEEQLLARVQDLLDQAA